jgi:hypothetical protein
LQHAQFILSFRKRTNRQAIDAGTALVLPDMFPGFGQIGPTIDVGRYGRSQRSRCLLRHPHPELCRLRINLRNWPIYPNRGRFAWIGAGGDKKPVDFRNKQRGSRSGYRRNARSPLICISLRLEHV